MTETPATLTDGISTIIDVFGQTMDLITSNPLLLAFVGASLIGLGFVVFRKAKRAVK